MALGGYDAVALVQEFTRLTGLSNTISIIALLSGTFGIDLRDAKDLAMWRGLGGPMSDEEFNRRSMDLIMANSSKWNRVDR